MQTTYCLGIYFMYTYNMQTKERGTHDTGDGDKKNLLYFLYTHIICKQRRGERTTPATGTK